MELVISLLLMLLGIALVLAWSIGLGWLLSHVLPFSLFEGSLLAMAASQPLLPDRSRQDLGRLVPL